MSWRDASVGMGDTLDKLNAVCQKSTGHPEEWEANGGKTYYLEHVGWPQGYRGPITGGVFCKDTGTRVGSYRIEGNGTIARMPASLRKLANV